VAVVLQREEPVGAPVHGEFQNAEELAIHAQASTFATCARAQFATLTVRIPQTERLEVEERYVGQSHPRMRGRCRVQVRRDGDEHGAGRSDALIEETTWVSGNTPRPLCCPVRGSWPHVVCVPTVSATLKKAFTEFHAQSSGWKKFLTTNRATFRPILDPSSCE
jgi:hypothetical protein